MSNDTKIYDLHASHMSEYVHMYYHPKVRYKKEDLQKVLSETFYVFLSINLKSKKYMFTFYFHIGCIGDTYLGLKYVVDSVKKYGFIQKQHEKVRQLLAMQYIEDMIPLPRNILYIIAEYI